MNGPNTIEAARAHLQSAGSNSWRMAGRDAQRYFIPQWIMVSIIDDLVAIGFNRDVAKAAVQAEFRIYEESHD